MKAKITYDDFALYFSNSNQKLRPRWILFKVFGDEKEAERIGKYLKSRYGWIIRIEKYTREAILT